MASGLPDYFSGIDITYQTLAQVTNRPKYGGANSELGSQVVVASDFTTLLSVAGKGMIYGGYFYLDYTASQKDGVFTLLVDGSTIADMDTVEMNKFRMANPWNGALYLLKYDDVNFIYSVGLCYGITFETGFTLQYQEVDGDTPTVFYRAIFALI